MRFGSKTNDFTLDTIVLKKSSHAIMSYDLSHCIDFKVEKLNLPIGAKPHAQGSLVVIASYCSNPAGAGT